MSIDNNNTRNIINIIYGELLSIVCEYNNVIICMDENKLFTIFNRKNGDKIVEEILLAGINDRYLILVDMSTHTLDRSTIVYDTINLCKVFESNRHMIEYYSLLCDDDSSWNFYEENAKICTLDGKIVYTSEYFGGIRLHEIIPLDKEIKNKDFEIIYVNKNNKVFLLEEVYHNINKREHYSICEYNVEDKELKVIKRFEQDDDLDEIIESVFMLKKFSIKSKENKIIQIVGK